MKLALLSDIHANIQALDACLQHALDQGTEQFVLLGDFVGYGANPVEVVQRVQALAADGALLIKGNHDAGAVSPPAFARTVGDSTTAWTHAQLAPEQRQFLHQLPSIVERGPQRSYLARLGLTRTTIRRLLVVLRAFRNQPMTPTKRQK